MPALEAKRGAPSKAPEVLGGVIPQSSVVRLPSKTLDHEHELKWRNNEHKTGFSQEPEE